MLALLSGSPVVVVPHADPQENVRPMRFWFHAPWRNVASLASFNNNRRSTDAQNLRTLDLSLQTGFGTVACVHNAWEIVSGLLLSRSQNLPYCFSRAELNSLEFTPNNLEMDMNLLVELMRYACRGACEMHITPSCVPIDPLSGLPRKWSLADLTCAVLNTKRMRRSLHLLNQSNGLTQHCFHFEFLW